MHGIVFKGIVMVPTRRELEANVFNAPPGLMQVSHSIDPFEDETGAFLELVKMADFSEGKDGRSSTIAFLNRDEEILTFAARHGMVGTSESQWIDRISEMAERVYWWRNGSPDLFVIESHPFSVSCPVPGSSGRAVEVVTSDLWTCLKLQFNLAVVDDTQFNECAVCEKTFAVRPPVTRKNRIYCSVACSSKAYRARKHIIAATDVPRVKAVKGSKNVTTKKKPGKKGSRRGVNTKKR